MITFSIITASVLLIFGIVFLSGKGDKLLAGEEESDKCIIKRLRLVWGIGLILGAASFLFVLDDSMRSWIGAILASVNMVAIILSGTWAKKKKDSDF